MQGHKRQRTLIAETDENSFGGIGREEENSDALECFTYDTESTTDTDETGGGGLLNHGIERTENQILDVAAGSAHVAKGREAGTRVVELLDEQVPETHGEEKSTGEVEGTMKNSEEDENEVGVTRCNGQECVSAVASCE